MKILLAEDDEISRRIMTAILERATPPFKVIATKTGTAAWNALSENPDVELGIFDLSMPEMDGVALLEKIRRSRQFSKLPIIVCTAASDRTTVARTIGLSVSSYMLKPVNSKSLLEKIRQIVEPPASVDPRQSQEAICARLGIDRDLYQQLCRELESNFERWLAQSKDLVSPDSIQSLAQEANSLKSACLALGADSLAAYLTEVESLAAALKGRVRPNASPVPDELVSLLASTEAEFSSLRKSWRTNP